MVDELGGRDSAKEKLNGLETCLVTIAQRLIDMMDKRTTKTIKKFIICVRCVCSSVAVVLNLVVV